MNNKNSWTVYILRCADQTLYTGIAKDLFRRVAQHNKGTGAKYTRGRTPVELVFAESMTCHGDALRREYAIKKMSAADKKKIIDQSCQTVENLVTIDQLEQE
ncbi:MAG: GIY-YIG nuclease family protein [Candidatus Thiodiazotropha sp.]|nr:GIY-YIG nuclease family protein [Candidatus Thiodiazotropha sp.]MCM8885491.1 GIY-YIG nuclease family protein [Candidatus Thiodiazotropha sp.]MCM8921559.1 GIY-YIG nuclease family protein [Candidatus Thiodiazotropha sp.]MCU7841632.1 GIY-YIG nuclease family protein [Candidatus Thiodiazotropha sp. (ex Troendleina suluensis)]MCU7883253.1 GIY-YIG nuclease family protein [Candidatus Thiodiazotropha sp. (ex Lucinoma annulata)]